MELKNHFITVDRTYKEGTVEVFEQPVNISNRVDLKKATLTITALGVYEANINNKKVGSMLFAPGYTYYPLHLNYQSYDVTYMLDELNSLKIYLGQGWYCGRFTHENKIQIYGEQPAVAWILEVELNDGTVETYKSSDSSVKTVVSPYAYAGMYDGEQYFANGSKDEVIEHTKYTGKLPENFENTIIEVKKQEEMIVKEVTVKDGVTILDFGQNFAGMVEINPNLMNSNSLKLRHGEILNPDGTIYTTNLRKAKAEVEYHKGEDRTKYTPKFTYMGFRYIDF